MSSAPRRRVPTQAYFRQPCCRPYDLLTSTWRPRPSCATRHPATSPGWCGSSRGRVAGNSPGSAAPRSRRRPLRRDPARAAGERRLDHSAAERAEVLREAAAAIGVVAAALGGSTSSCGSNRRAGIHRSVAVDELPATRSRRTRDRERRRDGCREPTLTGTGTGALRRATKSRAPPSRRRRACCPELYSAGPYTSTLKLPGTIGGRLRGAPGAGGGAGSKVAAAR